jgi:hypothetical protein
VTAAMQLVISGHIREGKSPCYPASNKDRQANYGV